jgi:hypothetical protein
MPQIRNGIFVALAVSATLGAAQLASGHDLIGRRQVAATVPEEGVNRAAKANRDVARVAPAGRNRTIALRFKELADTSVLVRVPVKEEARNRPVTPMKSGKSKNAVACEPPVSVLTEVAKLLEPGRCVT